MAQRGGRRVVVVISGLNGTDLERFLKRYGLELRDFEFDSEEADSEKLYELLQAEASKAWKNLQESALEFDGAYFPVSATAIHPVRQLRGKMAASLYRRREKLAPACTSPGMFFRAQAADVSLSMKSPAQ